VDERATKDLRLALQWTQQRTADFLDIPRGTYSKYEVAPSAGGRPITDAHAALLHDELTRQTAPPITALVPMGGPQPVSEEWIYDRVLLRATDVVLAIGMRRSGKSTQMAEQLRTRPRFVAIDPMLDFDMPGVPITPRFRPDLDRQIVRPVAKDTDDKRRQCLQAVEAAHAAGNFIIYIDELMALCTSRTMPPALYQAVFYGGHAGVGVWASTQRGINIPTDLPAQCSLFLLFEIRLENERKAIAANLGIDPDCIPREEHAVTIISRDSEPFTRDLNERRRAAREQESVEPAPARQEAQTVSRSEETAYPRRLQGENEAIAADWQARHEDRTLSRVVEAIGRGAAQQDCYNAILKDISPLVLAQGHATTPAILVEAVSVLFPTAAQDAYLRDWLLFAQAKYPYKSPQPPRRCRPPATSTPARARIVPSAAPPALPEGSIEGVWREVDDDEAVPEPTTARRGAFGMVHYADNDRPWHEQLSNTAELLACLLKNAPRTEPLK